MTTLDNLLKLVGTPRDGALLRFSLGNELLKVGNATEAIVQLRAAVDLDPFYSAAWKLLGKALTDADLPAGSARLLSPGHCSGRSPRRYSGGKGNEGIRPAHRARRRFPRERRRHRFGGLNTSGPGRNSLARRGSRPALRSNLLAGITQALTGPSRCAATGRLPVRPARGVHPVQFPTPPGRGLH